VVHPSNPISDMTDTAGYRELFQELRRLGYVEGRNLLVERYSAEGRLDRFGELARDVVMTKPDLIQATSNPLVLKFKEATSTIPIVGYIADPIAFGVVGSLARPGGNITGVSPHPGLDIWGKRLEILLEAVSASKVGFLTGASGLPGAGLSTVI